MAEGGGGSWGLGDGTWIPVSTCSAACLYHLLLKEKETLTLAFFIPQELMEGIPQEKGHLGPALWV